MAQLLQSLTPEQIATIAVVVLSIASGVLEKLGYTRASKIIGGLPAAVDIGGIIRGAARARDAKGAK